MPDRHIQNSVQHLKWGVLRKQLTAKLFSQNSPSWMFDRVLNTSNLASQQLTLVCVRFYSTPDLFTADFEDFDFCVSLFKKIIPRFLYMLDCINLWFIYPRFLYMLDCINLWFIYLVNYFFQIIIKLYSYSNINPLNAKVVII